MTEQAVILLVVIPLFVAPLVALFNQAKLAWLMTLLVCLTNLGLVGWLWTHLPSSQQVTYALGGWAAPWGIEYVLDPLNLLLLGLLSLVAAISLLYAYRSVEAEIEKGKIPLFYAAFLLCYLGLIGMLLTADIFNLFVFLEISSLSTYALIAMGKNRRALVAALQYLVVGTLGATFFLVGVGLAFAATGTLNMGDMQNKLAAVGSSNLVLSAFILIILGLALKAAIFPLHIWLTNAYSFAPSFVSVFLAATATKVAVYALVRSIFSVFGLEFYIDSLVPDLLVLIACTAILYGSYQAIQQNELKALLAYSSVAQLGYITLGVALATQAGLTAGLVHVFNHGVIKAALFMLAGIFVLRLHSSKLEDLQGMGKHMPWTLVALVIAGLSLIGVPGTAGFISKWHLLQAAIDKHWLLAVIILAGSAMAIMYVWKLVELLYFANPDKPRVHSVQSGEQSVGRLPVSMAIATWIMTLACVYFGLFPQLTITGASTAAGFLMAIGN